MLRKSIAASALVICLASGGWAQRAVETKPPELDPALALAAEYRRAVALDTNYALVEFIVRHPDEPLAETARSRLAARPVPEAARAQGPEADIYLAFDAARGARDPDAMAAFAARYSGHPISIEARRPIWSQ